MGIFSAYFLLWVHVRSMLIALWKIFKMWLVRFLVLWSKVSSFLRRVFLMAVAWF